MPLSVNFTDIDFEYIREMAALANTTDNTATLVGKVDSLNPAQVAAVQRDIEQWKRIEYGTERSKGGIKGTDFDQARNRQYITNKMRARLDYPPLPDPIDATGFGAFSIGMPSWFGSSEDEFNQ